ncbi:cryptochrome/photolyase family protein [Reinekea marinisedimentorum]|uniref:Deoxyribodipyrimidine photo-lyase n=1 Tax=Reinekea marinisedimentorum TaxID=230495 RepID=A0A4R3IGA4_9GAMM|nr:deoxyribodipyrimidine photo-lyase [Reinekea marinisedimentorum]TCS44042.1 deoxyribodipyrimidine photo-lyase [Reinekea marinisedimentorum]
MKPAIVIHWFRQDLRLADNPALTAAVQQGAVIPIYILDDDNAGAHAMGAASRWWLHHSLQALNDALAGKLQVFRGEPLTVLQQLITEHKVKAVYWNRCYEPWRMQRDASIKATLSEQNISVKSYNGSLLWEPWQINKKDGTPYKVFTPFYRKGCLNAELPRSPLPMPESLPLAKISNDTDLASLGLLPTLNWADPFSEHWHIGEQGAHDRFQQFLDEGLSNYKKGRDEPALNCVSGMSPHLHFGEVSPNQLWYAVRSMGESVNIEHFCSELAWREFSYQLLYHNPNLPTENLQKKFDHFPWQQNAGHLAAWQRGQTGIPMVDAGMRELWQTGYMHNRVRMIVGSFLVKNLRLSWHEGERWFWDTLLDADLANNSASWQWIAGCGADAAPYFRVFNPVTQGEKFDAQGEYIRRFIPELGKLPNKYLFAPWQAPAEILKQAGVVLGETYPQPIVDLKLSREAALEAFSTLKAISQP